VVAERHLVADLQRIEALHLRSAVDVVYHPVLALERDDTRRVIDRFDGERRGHFTAHRYRLLGDRCRGEAQHRGGGHPQCAGLLAHVQPRLASV